MPRATVASRELKNKETGLDLFVPTFKEVKGRLSSTVFYQVVVVTNQSIFKTPSHKESDVVQLSVERKWADFEEMRAKLNEAFAGTMLPAIDKKSFIVNDSVLKERRNSLDNFVKFLASVTKLAKSAPVLQFLGVDALRANKTKLEDKSDEKKAASAKDTEKVPDPEADVDVFGERQESADTGDLFDDDEQDEGDEVTFGTDKEDFGRSRGSFSMFEAQDMKENIDEEDEKEFSFVPDAIITKREVVVLDTGDDNDEEEKEKEDLFRIEDDLDSLLVVDIDKRKRREVSELEQTEANEKPPKPSPASKPKPSLKPGVPSKPEPRASAPNKPKVPPKEPAAQAAPQSPDVLSQDGGQSLSAVEVMQQDDLLAYLQEELTSNTEEVDLFS